MSETSDESLRSDIFSYAWVCLDCWQSDSVYGDSSEDVPQDDSNNEDTASYFSNNGDDSYDSGIDEDSSPFLFPINLG